MAGWTPIVCLWFLALALLPVNFFGMGSVEPSHILIAGALAVMFLAPQRSLGPMRTPPMDVALLAFVWLTYVSLVNFFWFAQHPGSSKFVATILYTGFNLVVMWGVVSMLQTNRAGMTAAFRWAVAIGLVVEIVAIKLGAGYRGTGTFDNPNAMGYWAVLAVACWIALKPHGERLGLLDAGVMVVALAVTVMSGSRAASGSVVGVILVALIFWGVPQRALPALVLAAMLGVGAMAFTGARMVSDFSEQPLAQRFADKTDAGELEKRNYDRIWNYPQYIVLGAGEGAWERFRDSDSVRSEYETHSTYATLLFSYGIVGSVIFACMLGMIFRSAAWREWALLASVGFYGLTHQGLRTTLLWVFFAVVIARGMHHANHQRNKRLAARLLAEPDDQDGKARWSGGCGR